MGLFAAGQVVLLPFPFSDLSRSKLRPALILADAGRGDWIVCQITSNPYGDLRSFPLSDADFSSGGLQHTSFIRPTKIFTAHVTLITSSIGTLHAETLDVTRTAVIAAIRET
jgi:mRNA interferase MazF